MRARVLILGSDDPLAPRPGGWQTIVRTFLERCSDPGRYAIASPGYGSCGRWSERTLVGRTYPQFRLDAGRAPLLRSHRLQSSLAVVRHYRRLRGFDVVYSHGPELLLPFVLGRFRGRLVLHVLGDVEADARHARTPVFRPFAGLYRRLALWVVRRCDCVLWVDATRVPDLAPDVAVRSEVLTTFYDPDVFRPWDGPRPEGPPRLVSVARLAPVKRLDVVLGALAEATSRGEDWRLSVCGDGEMQGALRALAAQLGVEGRVEWLTRHLAPEELAEVVRRADVGLLVSASEGSPAAVKELLASGVPVVVSDVGDNRTIVRDGVNGILLDRVDALSVYDGIRRALALPTGARTVAAESVASFAVDRWAVRLETLLA